MISIDTNVVVRFLVRDNLNQFRRADRLIRENEVFVALTVVLEAEWVLRDAYEKPRRAVAQALRDFGGLPTVVLEDAPRVLRALDWAGAGMDLADALHLSASAQGAAFASFDRKLAKIARRLQAPEVREP
jgi:predicted nucleic acid-binding protein